MLNAAASVWFTGFAVTTTSPMLFICCEYLNGSTLKSLRWHGFLCAARSVSVIPGSLVRVADLSDHRRLRSSASQLLQVPSHCTATVQLSAVVRFRSLHGSPVIGLLSVFRRRLKRNLSLILFCYIALSVTTGCRSLCNNWHLRGVLLAADWCVFATVIDDPRLIFI